MKKQKQKRKQEQNRKKDIFDLVVEPIVESIENIKISKRKKRKKDIFDLIITPIAVSIEKNKLKTFLGLYAIWLVDLASTAIALGLYSDTLGESNPMAALFFSFGIKGWITWMIICAILIYILLSMPAILFKISTFIFRCKRGSARQKEIKKYYRFILLLLTGLYYIIELMVIIGNIRLIIWSFANG